MDSIINKDKSIFNILMFDVRRSATSDKCRTSHFQFQKSFKLTEVKMTFPTAAAVAVNISTKYSILNFRYRNSVRPQTKWYCNNQERNWTRALEFNDSIMNKNKIFEQIKSIRNKQMRRSHIVLAKCMFWNHNDDTQLVVEKFAYIRDFRLHILNVCTFEFLIFDTKIKSFEAKYLTIVKFNHKIIKSFICCLKSKWFCSSRWETNSF